MAWGRYIAVATIAIAIVVALVWEPSRSMSARIGTFLIAVGFISLVALPFRHRRAGSAAYADPTWRVILSCVGLILMGIEGVWPQHRVSMIGGIMIIAPSVPEMIRRYR